MPWPHSSPLNILHMTDEHEIRTIHVSLAAGDPKGDKRSDLSGHTLVRPTSRPSLTVKDLKLID
jgi:hypothetical protein